VVHPSFPAKSVPELIAHAKSNPGKIIMASGGVGSAQGLVALRQTCSSLPELWERGCKSSRAGGDRLVLQPRGLARNLRPRHRPKTHQRLASGRRGAFLVGGGVRYLVAPQPARQFVLWRIAKLLIYRMSPGCRTCLFMR
jgi:Tripartite tricarboxylate transporter family receptor